MIYVLVRQTLGSVGVRNTHNTQEVCNYDRI